jgi:zinc transport system substrate-binding protein
MIAILIRGRLAVPPMSRTVLVLIFILSLTACGGSGSSSDHRTTVEAAFYPLAWAAERVGGDAVEVRNLTKPGVEPHDVELGPRDVEDIRSADVVLYLGSGFQPAVEDAVEGAGGTTVDLLEGEELLRPAEAQGELEADPHVWLDPKRYADMVRTIAETLGRPEDAAPLVEDLEALDADYRAGLADCARRQIVTAHTAFGYLARRYDLEQNSLTGLSPEAEPTPRDLERLVEQVRDSGATTIFFESLVSPRLAETVARETGARTDSLNPLEGLDDEELRRGDDYLSVMRENLASLRRALDCR